MPAIGVSMRMNRTLPTFAIVSVWVACTAMVDPGCGQPSGITYQRVRRRDTTAASQLVTPGTARNRDGDSPPRSSSRSSHTCSTVLVVATSTKAGSGLRRDGQRFFRARIDHDAEPRRGRDADRVAV